MSQVPEPAHASSLAKVVASESRQAARESIAMWSQRALTRLRGLRISVACALEEDHEVMRAVFVHGEGHGEVPARLFVESSPDGLDVALEIPSAGFGAVRERLFEPVCMLELDSALRALPEQFALRSAGGSASFQMSLLTRERLLEIFGHPESEENSIWIGWTVPRAVALGHADALDDQVEDALVALALTGMRLAWTPDGALAGARERDLEQGVIERTRLRPDESAAPGAHKLRRRRKLRHVEREAEADGELECDGAAEGEPTGHAGVRAGETRNTARVGSRRTPTRRATSSRLTIGPGARVRVLEGPFAGRIGLVQELDGKGGARVMLGLLAVRVATRDLVPWSPTAARPKLSSSHRRPSPVRS
ncbi:MAG: KOW motif-containing protein [Polyangiaceae bacterium]|jgi:hypothetical protein